MTTLPNRALIGWSFARKKGLRLIGLRTNLLGNNPEPAKHLMLGRTGRVMKIYDGSSWRKVVTGSRAHIADADGSLSGATATVNLVLDALESAGLLEVS